MAELRCQLGVNGRYAPISAKYAIPKAQTPWTRQPPWREVCILEAQ